MVKRALCSFGVDVDAVSGWLGSYGGEDSPNDITRGMFAGEVGVPRLLKLFKKYNIKTTWFIPGHSLETFPTEMAAVRDAGHEIGLHGYTHENPKEMTVSQQTEVLNHTFQLLTDFCGKPPVGSVAPWWEVSEDGVKLLLDKGIQYDHSSQAHDCLPFYCRDKDTWTNIDYSTKSAHEWMKPLERGKQTSLLQIPANWYLDDLPPHMFIKASHASHGFVDADVTLKLWEKHFEYFYREYDWFIFPLTIHPDVSGRPHVLLILEELIEWTNGHEGVEWVTMKQINDEFREKNPPPEGAVGPSDA
ncbi:glycoside hydrolase/deacetylase [Cylindrobasidium torrendii FP15055 ss-10]|uniref:Glycoside hydrolase/deacetylase n=1 Tax=Cylindrobasidium torrendii FP15055 ss-10 TaxID=1314674 RepID=A0A0D7BHK8_9AGAR|nr:glycoside hydrolase/deacetylase [Cylindrobasidium torrendii FP15055 ss-10]